MNQVSFKKRFGKNTANTKKQLLSGGMILYNMIQA
jgi:hypothetical protein